MFLELQVPICKKRNLDTLEIGGFDEIVKKYS